MNIFERSFAYITRKKTRAMIILLILSIIVSSIYACLAINRASCGLENRILKASNSSFEIIRKSSGSGIKIFDIQEIAKKHQIKDVNYRYSTDVNLKTGQVVSGNQKIQVDNIDEKFKNLLKLHSVATSVKENAFLSESFQLISGKHISSAENQHQILVHEKLAEKNHWRVGDKITLSSLTDRLVQAEFTITGIFSGQIQESFNGLSSDLSENIVYTNFSSGRPFATPAMSVTPNQTKSQLANINYDTKDFAEQATFFLDQSEKIDQIITSIKKYPLDWQELDIIKNTKAFENIISSVKTMQGIISVMTLSIIIAGITALSLVLVLWLRERVYEIGVLLALGKTKFQIVGQFILELVMISIPATLAVLFFGNFLSVQLLNSLLAEEDLSELSTALLINPFSMENLLVLVSSLVILFIIITSAVFITSFAILSQKPKKILSKIS